MFSKIKDVVGYVANVMAELLDLFLRFIGVVAIIFIYAIIIALPFIIGAACVIIMVIIASNLL